MIKKRVTRHNFNMVEIMLAVIIIALGLTSTFVLFPVGLNAAKDAIAENNTANASEEMTTIIHTHILPKMFNTGLNKGFAFKSAGDLKSYFYDPENTSEEIKNYIENGIETPVGTEIRTDLHKLTDGVFIYNCNPASSGRMQTSMMATVKLESDSFDTEYFYTRSGDYQQYLTLKTTTNDCINKFLLPIVIEVSWPANLPMSEREKRIYRFEMFNHEYDPGTDEDAKPQGA